MVLYLQSNYRNMAKFKFKGTTTEDVEEELERLCTMDAKEIPLNYIIKVVSKILARKFDSNIQQLKPTAIISVFIRNIREKVKIWC